MKNYATFCEKWRKKLLKDFVNVAVKFAKTPPSSAQIARLTSARSSQMFLFANEQKLRFATIKRSHFALIVAII